MKTKLSDAAAAAAFEDFSVTTAIRHDRSEIAAIEAAVNARIAADDRVEQAVRDARAAGVPWVAIGIGLGVSHQAAIKKYGPRL